MRYCIREATSSDVDRVAALIGENASEWSGSTASDVVERLQRICHHSLRVWVAVDHRGVPGGLFGSRRCRTTRMSGSSG